MKGLPCLAVAVGMLAAACGGPEGSEDFAHTGECPSSLPVALHFAGDEHSTVVGVTLPRVCPAEIGFATSETTLVVSNKGTVIFSPAENQNSLARSTDGGATWALSSPADIQLASKWNQSDAFLTWDAITGRIFWIRATGAKRELPDPDLPRNTQLPTGAQGFEVSYSDDDAKTWTTTSYLGIPDSDWPKLVAGPPPDGASASQKPVGYPNVVYVCGNSPYQGVGPARACFKSLDGGGSFVFAGFVTPSAQRLAYCPPLTSNTGFVDSHGAFYQPINCQDGAFVAVSQDEGSNYVFYPVPDAPPSKGYTRGPSTGLQIVGDVADNLYATWVSETGQIEFAISTDHAQTWGDPMVMSPPELSSVTRPAPAAGRRGQFGMAYYATSSAGATNLTLYITQTHNALGTKPKFITGALNDPLKPIYIDNSVRAVTPRADFIGAAFDSKGMLWAGGVKQIGNPDGDGNIQTTGLVGHFADTTGQPD